MQVNWRNRALNFVYFFLQDFWFLLFAHSRRCRRPHELDMPYMLSREQRTWRSHLHHSRMRACDVQKLLSRFHSASWIFQVSVLPNTHCPPVRGECHRRSSIHKKPSNAGTDGCTRLVQSRLVSSTRAQHLFRTDFTHDLSRPRSNIHTIPTRILYCQERCLTHHPPGCDSPRFLNNLFLLI